MPAPVPSPEKPSVSHPISSDSPDLLILTTYFSFLNRCAKSSFWTCAGSVKVERWWRVGLWLVINCGEKRLKNDRPVGVSISWISLDFTNAD
jgi:hypothetical protein